jgi:hypothetical protein
MEQALIVVGGTVAVAAFALWVNLRADTRAVRWVTRGYITLLVLVLVGPAVAAIIWSFFA